MDISSPDNIFLFLCLSVLCKSHFSFSFILWLTSEPPLGSFSQMYSVTLNELGGLKKFGKSSVDTYPVHRLRGYIFKHLVFIFIYLLFCIRYSFSGPVSTTCHGVALFTMKQTSFFFLPTLLYPLMISTLLDLEGCSFRTLSFLIFFFLFILVFYLCFISQRFEFASRMLKLMCKEKLDLQKVTGI